MRVWTRRVEREARMVTAASIEPVMEWINSKPGSCAEVPKTGGQFDPMSCSIIVDSGGYRFGVRIGDWIVEINNTFHRLSDDQFWAAYEGL